MYLDYFFKKLDKARTSTWPYRAQDQRGGITPRFWAWMSNNIMSAIDRRHWERKSCMTGWVDLIAPCPFFDPLLGAALFQGYKVHPAAGDCFRRRQPG
jgi:hypothetical protein